MYQGLLFFPRSRHKSAPCCVGWHGHRPLILCGGQSSLPCSICVLEDSLSLSITRHKCPCLRRQIGKEKQIFRMLQKYSMTPGTLSETAPALKLLFVQGTSRANRSSNSGAKINCFTNVFAPTFPMLCFCHRQATVFEHRSSGSVPMLLSSSAHSS